MAEFLSNGRYLYKINGGGAKKIGNNLFTYDSANKVVGKKVVQCFAGDTDCFLEAAALDFETGYDKHTGIMEFNFEGKHYAVNVYKLMMDDPETSQKVMRALDSRGLL